MTLKQKQLMENRYFTKTKMKNIRICGGKVYIEDDRWVTIRGRHVLIKGNDEADNVEVYIHSTDPEELTLVDKNGNTQTIKRGKPMSFKEADSKKPNPNYEKEWKYEQNCQVCVAAFELRLRGYDVEAIGFDYGNKAIRELEEYPNMMFNSQRMMYPIDEDYEPWSLKGTYSAITETIKSGERYHMGIHWASGNGHVLTIQKAGNELMVYDPQDGSTYKGVKEIRDNLLKGVETVLLYRVDDKPINTELASKVLKKAGT